jgi:iron complex outermembrane receptor protein
VGYEGATGNTIQNHQVGYAPSSFYVYEQAYGVNGKPLDGVYIDRNKDGIITEQDKYRFHKPAADIFYGFNTSVTYIKILILE